MTKEDLILSLKLETHPLEGDYFRRTYESETSFESEIGSRKLLTSIYYMLTSDLESARFSAVSAALKIGFLVRFEAGQEAQAGHGEVDARSEEQHE